MTRWRDESDKKCFRENGNEWDRIYNDVDGLVGLQTFIRHVCSSYGKYSTSISQNDCGTKNIFMWLIGLMEIFWHKTD